MLPMLFPHVFSTETKSETIMGLSHDNSLKSMSRASGSSVFEVVSGGSDVTRRSRRRRGRRRLRQLFLWRQRSEQQLLQLQHQHQQHHISSIPFKSCHHANTTQFVPTILCINQKIERGTSRNTMPSGQVWPNDELCFSAATINRRPRSKCNCMPFVAMARFALCKRTQANTIVPKRNRSHLCVLQSDPLVPDMSNRYSSVCSSCLFSLVFFFFVLEIVLPSYHTFVFESLSSVSYWRPALSTKFSTKLSKLLWIILPAINCNDWAETVFTSMLLLLLGGHFWHYSICFFFYSIANYRLTLRHFSITFSRYLHVIQMHWHSSLLTFHISTYIYYIQFIYIRAIVFFSLSIQKLRIVCWWSSIL